MWFSNLGCTPLCREPLVCKCDVWRSEFVQYGGRDTIPSDPMIRHGSFGQCKEEPYFSRYLYAFKILTFFLK